jgi:hypothetical protein
VLCVLRCTAHALSLIPNAALMAAADPKMRSTAAAIGRM